jgi:hypothetical protein
LTTETNHTEGATTSEPGTDVSGVPFCDRLHHIAPGAAILGVDGLRIDDFWGWAYGNLMTNTHRGILAEFLVGSALGVLDVPRVEYDVVDLRYHGRGIEVKAGGYLQAWPQRQLSTPVFGIAPRFPDTTVPGVPHVARHWAGCYVFCLFGPTRHDKANPVDVGTWQFYPLATSKLPLEQKSLGLVALEHRGALPVSLGGLRDAVDRELGLTTPSSQSGGSLQTRHSTAEPSGDGST